jgi:hypothetical protein
MDSLPITLHVFKNDFVMPHLHQVAPAMQLLESVPALHLPKREKSKAIE